MSNRTARRLESANTGLLVGTLVLSAAGARVLASLLAAGFASVSLWLLFQDRSARARLQTGISLPLLVIAAADHGVVVAYLVVAAVAIALQEGGWRDRLASLLTLVFPLLLLHGMTAYFRWIHYTPVWLTSLR